MVDLFTRFEAAVREYDRGHTKAWSEFMDKQRKRGIAIAWVEQDIWCANHCILLAVEDVDATEIL